MHALPFIAACCVVLSLISGCASVYSDPSGLNKQYVPAGERRQLAAAQQRQPAFQPAEPIALPVAQPGLPGAQAAVAGGGAPHAPGDMQLGTSYTSALNEPCYEAFPLQGFAGQPRAYCLRGGSWVLLPNVFMTIPASGGLPLSTSGSPAVPSPSSAAYMGSEGELPARPTRATKTKHSSRADTLSRRTSKNTTARLSQRMTGDSLMASTAGQ